MKEAYDIASKNVKKTTARGKAYYDQKRQSSVLSPGDRVLVRNMSERGGPGKLRSYWEEQIHVVVSQKGENSPVYEVKPERGTGRGRILHRNMLMPCNALPLERPAQFSVGGQKPHSQRRKRQTETKANQMNSESSDEEEHYWAHRLRHHHQSREPDVAPSVAPGVVQQPAPGAEECRAETSLPILMDNDTSENDTQILMDNDTSGDDTQILVDSDTTGDGIQEVARTVQSADLPGNQEPKLSETQPRRSQRERRPKETLTYESLGQPVHRVVGLHNSPLYVNTLSPVYEQYGMPWASPELWGAHLVYPSQVCVGYYRKTICRQV